MPSIDNFIETFNMAPLEFDDFAEAAIMVNDDIKIVKLAQIYLDAKVELENYFEAIGVQIG